VNCIAALSVHAGKGRAAFQPAPTFATIASPVSVTADWVIDLGPDYDETAG